MNQTALCIESIISLVGIDSKKFELWKKENFLTSQPRRAKRRILRKYEPNNQMARKL
ncbi:hypothetical protein GCM10010916_28200 [Paenibacillus abyssi]|uniref:Uncharacterized protein n=1 Tax=Paenibacillus abyssi TaxID=1340531 RepID=A0A917D3W5_9BACL|nr:hypothetical protein GCM10010916_28200 [Paenibacillus abyssi]